MGHKGPVEDLHATEPKWYEPIYYSILFYSILFYSILFYSILFYHAGLLPLILFVAAFSPSPESQSLNTTAIACK